MNMYEIVSSGRNTQWHCFPNFQTKCSYSHIANEPVDFQTISTTNTFLEINKKHGFELLRTYNKDGTDIIQRVKKCQLDDISYGAACKTGVGEVALGFTTGFVRIFDMTKSKFTSKLQPDKLGNSVIGLDYSCCDEYLASLYDTGDINLYGLKTGVKMDLFRMDGNTTTIRFHPTKRLYLAAASYLGAVTILDTQSKRKIFLEKSAHSAPCRDIAMSIGSPDILASCGYDCKVNFHDIRKRRMVEQITQQHPLACVALSPCGNFICTGNLKGEISSYDFRNVKEALDTKRVHDDGVIRVGFIPLLSDVNLSGKSANFSTIIKDTTATPSSITDAGRISVGGDFPDSFANFIDIYQANAELNACQSSPRRRDSWMDMISNKRLHDFSVDSNAVSPSQISLGGEFSELRLRRVSRLSTNSTSGDIFDAPRVLLMPEIGAITEEMTNVPTEMDAKRPRSDATEANSVIPKPKSNATECDNEIGSSATRDSHPEYRSGKAPAVRLSMANKENQQHNQQDLELFARYIKDVQFSTPNSNHIPGKSRGEMSTMALSEAGSDSLKQIFSEVIDTKLNDFREELQATMDAKFDALGVSVLKKMHETENEIKFYQDKYYNLGFTGSFRLFKLMEREIDVLKEGMAVLLGSDNIAEEYYRVKAENEELKRRLQG